MNITANHYRQWCFIHNLQLFPASETSLTEYITAHVSQWPPGTMRTKLTQLRSYHVDGRHGTTAFKADILKRAIDGVKRVHGKQLKPPRKQVTFDILNVITDQLTNSYGDLSMKTALCVALAGLLRPQNFTYPSWTPFD